MTLHLFLINNAFLTHAPKIAFLKSCPKNCIVDALLTSIV